MIVWQCLDHVATPRAAEDRAETARRYAFALARLAIMPDDVPDDLRAEVAALVRPAVERLDRERRRRNRVGLRLLRSLLTPAERDELRRTRRVTVLGSAGGLYRLFPATGGLQRLEVHGRLAYVRSTFCLHDEGRAVPAADLSASHLLMLRADEDALLAEANETPTHNARRGGPLNMGWDGEWQRQLRRRDPAEHERETEEARQRMARPMSPEDAARLTSALRSYRLSRAVWPLARQGMLDLAEAPYSGAMPEPET